MSGMPKEQPMSPGKVATLANCRTAGKNPPPAWLISSKQSRAKRSLAKKRAGARMPGAKPRAISQVWRWPCTGDISDGNPRSLRYLASKTPPASVAIRSASASSSARLHTRRCCFSSSFIRLTSALDSFAAETSSSASSSSSSECRRIAATSPTVSSLACFSALSCFLCARLAAFFDVRFFAQSSMVALLATTLIFSDSEFAFCSSVSLSSSSSQYAPNITNVEAVAP
mmetsp:Transcript_57004/g.185264  ORF Transcript_57004/g.185264 Transcript_57004/m.185264 type:complete len:228 (+) Transcript_57004:621-1304(+)